MGKIAKARHIGSEETAHHLRGALVRLGMDREELLADIRETATDHEGLLRIIMREIDEVVLSRKLAVLSEDGIEATFVVSNRRLIELRTNDTNQPDVNGGGTEPEVAALAYAQSIKKIGGQAAGVTLQHIGRASKLPTSSTACSAVCLSEISETLGRENRMHNFFRMIRTRAKGWIVLVSEGTDVWREGPEAILVRLDTLERITAANRETEGSLRRLYRAGPSCSAFAMTPEIQAIVAKNGKDRLLAAVSNQDVIAIMEDWREVFGNGGQGPEPALELGSVDDQLS
ncbi:hypothetical protein SAMN04488077_1275 [Roseovarius tolerans]|uniref:Uncharacterized protein n=1 Tax=Roseovarius tolerans TaxID=74031 RepID=A0A1H8J1T0_9RHOB|nr:hypothetical protein [Roseovarius tolerans]SEN74631.1 hypothetical protein SAMN04488077_1275 [Roseovarius tolerans]